MKTMAFVYAAMREKEPAKDPKPLRPVKAVPEDGGTADPGGGRTPPFDDIIDEGHI
jgi:hypothetical protein